VAVVTAVAPKKKPSRWNKLSMEDLRSKYDWEIDFDDETPREELIRALENYIH
jgi:hypothetical protein